MNTPTLPASDADGTVLSEATSTAMLKHAFSVLLGPNLKAAYVPQVLAAVEVMHTDSVQRFGWRAAEQLRSDAFAKALAASETDSIEHLPVPEVSDSDFLAFEKARTHDGRTAP